MDTVKDHLKSKKHCSRREEKQQQQCGAASSRQTTLVLDYLKICTVADIPLKKTEKTISSKHYKQAGALPKVAEFWDSMKDRFSKSFQVRCGGQLDARNIRRC